MIDVLNEFGLISSVLLIFSPIIVFFYGSNFIKDRLGIFLGLNTIFLLLFVLIIDPKLGIAMDWDLLALPVGALSVSVLLALLNTKFRLLSFRSGGMALAMISLATFFIWILANSSVRSELARAEDLLATDSRESGYSTELLANYYSNIGNDKDHALRLLLQISPVHRNARVWEYISRTQLELGRFQESYLSALSGIKLDSSKADLQFYAGVSLARSGENDKAIPYLQNAKMLAANDADKLCTIGQVYTAIDKLPLAIAAFRNAIKIDSNYSPPYLAIAQLYLKMGNRDSSLIYIQQCMRISPNNRSAAKLLDILNKVNKQRPN